MTLPSFVKPAEDGTIVEAFVQPRAGVDGIVGIHGRALKIRVRAAPVEGQANRAVERVLARALGIARSRVEVVAGHASRTKRIAIAGMGAESVACELENVLSSRAHESGQEARDGGKRVF